MLIQYRVPPAVTASASEKARFHAGPLRIKWAARYPQIFDEQEVRIAANQAAGHFYEWFAADGALGPTPFELHPITRLIVRQSHGDTCYHRCCQII
jgi:hypothetical protein